MTSRRVLLVPHGMHSFLELMPAAQALVERGHQVFMISEGALEPAAAEQCARHGVVLMSSTAKVESRLPPEAAPVRSGWRRCLAQRVGWLRAPLASGWDFFATWRACARFSRQARAVLEASQADVVVCFNDRTISLATHLMVQVRRHGGHTVLPPHEAINDGQHETIEARRDCGFLAERLSWSERLIAALLARLGYRVIAQSPGGPAVYWQWPSVMAAGALYGAASRNPWVRGGHHQIDTVAVAANHYRDLLIEAGVPAQKIVTTGYSRHDQLAAAYAGTSALRHRLLQLYGIPTEAPLVVIGLPYISQYVYTSRAQLFADLQFIFAEVERRVPQAYLLLSRHPRTGAEELRELLGSARRILLDDISTHQAIAVSTVYICSFSGTSYAALAAGRCLLSFDFYGTNTYGAFIGWTDDALHAFSREEFSRCLARFAEPPFRAAHLAKVRGRAMRYGRLDGRCTERLVDVILGVPRTGDAWDAVESTGIQLERRSMAEQEEL
jgi:hypothetical protein